VLVEQVEGAELTGHAAHQGPDVDGTVRIPDADGVRRGQFLPCFVVDTDGVDLVGKPVGEPW
jgi:hypothetical protein